MRLSRGAGRADVSPGVSELKTDLLEFDRPGQVLPLTLAAVVPLGNLTLWVQVSHGKASYSVCHRALRKNVINPTKQSTTALHRTGDRLVTSSGWLSRLAYPCCT